MDWSTAWQTAAAVPRPEGEVDLPSALMWLHEHGPASLSGEDGIAVAEALVLQSKASGAAPPGAPAPPAASGQISGDREVRAGIQQAKVGDTGLTVLSGESLLIAAIIGVRTQSWATGIFVFLGLVFLFLATAKSEKLGTLVALCIGIAWGAAAALLAISAQAGSGMTWAAAILAGLFGLG